MNIRLPIQIVLASKSPRRVDLLTQLLDHQFGEGVVTFAIDPPNIDETALTGETPIAHVQRLAVDEAHEADRAERVDRRAVFGQVGAGHDAAQQRRHDDSGEGLLLSPRISIARWLIDSWLAGQDAGERG
mgnify:CR=1 FL=1